MTLQHLAHRGDDDRVRHLCDAPSQPLVDGAPTPSRPGAGEQGEDLVVTGIRRAIADSISLKRDETSIVEAIDAGLLAGAVTLVWRAGEGSLAVTEFVRLVPERA